MFLFVGLGNVGDAYRLNRHNVGFQAIDFVCSQISTTPIYKNAFKGELYKSTLGLFLKPTTFMNDSGISVSAVASFYKIPLECVVIIYDDMDIAHGGLKFKIGGGDGGHNGIKSINAHLPNTYNKIKIGIGRPKGATIPHVLGDFSTQDQNNLKPAFNHILQLAQNLHQKTFQDLASILTLKPTQNPPC